MTFNVRGASLRAINSMTKYPSIPTYHQLDPKNGTLTGEHVQFTDKVIGTEKVDGTNSRIVLLPDGTWLLGSREELLHAKGDLLHNPALGIVDALGDLADGMSEPVNDRIMVVYLELYGHKIGGAAKNYTITPGQVGWRVFDVALLDNYAEIINWPTERISHWRDNSGQPFMTEYDLTAYAATNGLELTPRLFCLDASEVPTDMAKMKAFLDDCLPRTFVALDGATAGKAEGIVLRTDNRSAIAKARFQDYERTLKRRR